jgi:hypothetical protein
MNAAAAALAYALRGWHVSPWKQVGDRKFPLTEHGHLDATVDASQIEEWWREHPHALVSIATGERSGIVILDIDVRPQGSGWDSLSALGVSFHPETPTAHSPRGGSHCLFKWPGYYVKSVSGALGPHLDIKGDGGSAILPPGPGRWWDPHLGPDTPVAPMPDWMVIAEPERIASANKPVRPTRALTPYAESALDNACRRIIAAPAGEQETTLNGESFSIGTLAGAGAIPIDFARKVLFWAARQMPDHDPCRPWRRNEIEDKVNRAFNDGLRQPREARHAAV